MIDEEVGGNKQEGDGQGEKGNEKGEKVKGDIKVPKSVLVLSILYAVFLGFWIGSMYGGKETGKENDSKGLVHGESDCRVWNQTTQYQAQANIEQAKAQVENNKKLQALQMEVIRKCVENGRVPVMAGGNVDCVGLHSKVGETKVGER